MFIKNEESFYNDAENKKVGEQVVTFEVKEDQPNAWSANAESNNKLKTRIFIINT